MAANIWSRLAVDYGATFTEAERLQLAPRANYFLLACTHCGLHYFDPAVPGDGNFYARLGRDSNYYVGEKWDFGAALVSIGTGDRLLDVACGQGRFLEIAKAHGAQPVGLDTNPDAIGAAREKGLKVHDEDVGDFSVTHVGEFDVVTAFQVLEHVPDPVSFVRAASVCLRSGGRLILTVPNRDRLLKDSFEPLDHPPHHLSRWSSAQFAALALRTGMRLVGMECEPASMHHCRLALRKRVAGPASNTSWARALGFLVFNPPVYGLMKRTGLIKRLRLWGMSLAAVLERT